MKTSLTYFAVWILCLFSLIMANEAQAQCNSQNVTVNDFFFTDEFGNPFDPNAGYEIGENVNGIIWATFGGSSSNGYSLYMEYDVYLNDANQGFVSQCIFNQTQITQNTPVQIATFSWPWGDKFELKNFYMDWKTNSSPRTCEKADRNSQCWSSPEGFLVRTPLVANFDFNAPCSPSGEVSFTNITTGGNTDSPYASYSWDFGDGTTANTQSPSHTYASAGTYTVVLEVEDVDGVTSSITKSVEAFDAVTGSLSAIEETCSSAEDGQITVVSAAGGDGSYSYSISPNVGTLNGSTFSGLPAGDYTVTIQDGRSCSVDLNATINVGDDAAPVMTAPGALSIEACGVNDLVGSGQTALAYADTETAISLAAFQAEGGSIVEDNIASITYQDSFSGTCPIIVTRTFTVTDDCGQSDVEVQSISVNDTTDPTFTSTPSSPQVKVIAAGGSSYTSSGTEFDAVASDNCSSVELSYSINGGTPVVANTLDGVSFGLGDTDVTWIATDACGNSVEYDFVVTVYAPDISITKTVNNASISAPGDLNYTVTIVNEGNQDLTGIVVTDLMPNSGSAVALSNPSGDDDSDGVLDVGETWVYTTVYSATQADIDAGADLVNEAFVDTDQTDKISDDATTTIDQTPGIAIEKSVDTGSISAPTTLNYTITVTNTGNVSLTNVSVSDAFAGGATLESGDTDNDGELDLTETWIYSASYDATQSDIDAGADLVNTAVVSSAETADAEDDATTTITQTPGIAIVKAVDKDIISSPTTLNYTITVTNTGNVTLTNVSVADAFAGGATLQSGDTDNDGKLDLTETWVYTASYDATQADIDAGTPLVNTAVVSSDETADEQDEATTTIEQNAGIAIEKIVDATSIGAPTTLNYTITVTNTGNVSLTGVSVADAFAGGATLESGDADNDGELDLTESWEYSASYDATQADIDAGDDLINTAVVSSNETADAQDDAITTISQGPGIAIEKTVNIANISGPTTLNYTITVRNTGNVSLTNISVADVFAGGATLVSGDEDNDSELDLDEEWIYSASYDATQADIDAGTPLVNTAVVSSAETADAQDDAVTTITQIPGIAIVKEVDQEIISAPTTLNYTITVTNTGNVSLTGVSVADAFAGGATLESGDADNDGELDLDEKWEYSASYDATQTDIDGGATLVNTAIVSSNETGNVQDDAVTTISRSPGIAIEKEVDVANISSPTTLNYTITVTNTGNVSLTGVSVADAFAGGATLQSGDDDNDGELDLTETWVYTASYDATQADIDAGADLVNTAVVSSNETADAQDDAVTTITQNPGFTVSKIVNLGNINSPTTLSYTIEIVNTGNISLNNVNPVDVLPGGGSGVLAGPTESVNANGVLDVGEKWTYTATYDATQKDIDKGFPLINTVTVTVDELESPISDDAATTISQNAGIAITKSVDESNISSPTTLNYTITVTNTGNVSLTGVNVTDAFAGGANLESGDVDNDGELDLTETWVYSASYDATQADIDAGADLVNTAIVSSNETADAQDDATTTITQNAGIAVVKDVDAANISAPTTLNYTITVTNTGNVSLTGVSVADAFADGATFISGDADNDGELDLTESWVYSASYEATQSDIDAGTDLVNTAIVSNNETADTQDDAVTVITQSPEINLVKTADKTEGVQVGDVVTYTYLVENTGNTTVYDVQLSDVHPGAGELSDISPAMVDELAPGASTEFTATYVVVQEDVDNAAPITNVATATATGTDESALESTDDETITPVTGSPMVSIIKEGTYVDVNGDMIPNVGDQITYTFTVTNAGNVTLDNVVVADPLVTVEGSAISLAPGEENADNFTAVYTLTQADIDAGSFTNTATVTANDPKGETVNNSDDDVQALTQSPSVSMNKVADKTTYSAVGEEITYTLTVSNTGNVTLTDAVVTDPLTGLEENVGALVPGEQKVVMTSYSITQEDLDNGMVTNIASVTSDSPSEEEVNDSDEVTVEAEQNGSIILDKSTESASFSTLGEEIHYTLEVTNTGNITVHNVMVVDPLTGFETTIASIAPGQSEVMNTTYTVTQADLDKGFIVNVAKADAEGADGEDVQDEDEVNIPAVANAIVDIEKSADKESFSVVGEEITYTLTVTNSGNVTLSNVTVEDPLTDFETTVASLAPGESQAFNTVYTVTQADLDNGGVTNVATATATDPQGNSVGDEASESSGASFNPIIANDDHFGVLNSPQSRVFGNILTNDRLNGQPVSPDDVDFEFTDLDGIIGLEIAADGTLSVLPGVEPREYTLRYELREKLNPSNMDDAIVTFRIQANTVTVVDDNVVTDQNQEVTIDVMENDITDFVALDPSSVTIITGTANGTLTVNNDGTVTYTPNANFNGTDSFTYQVCDESLPTPICGTATVTITVRELSMSLSKSVDLTSVGIGEMVTYTITLTNNSEYAVENVVLEDLLPAEMMFVSSTLATSGDNTWEISSIAAGETITFDVQVMTMAEGAVVNVINLTAGDYTLSAQAETVVIERREIDMSITKTSFGVEIYEGDQFDYQIVVVNEGDTDASDVVITDMLPSNVSFVDASFESSSEEIVPEMNVNAQNITWTIPYFPAGAEVTITLTVRAEQPGTVINEATVEGAEDEINPEDNTARDQNSIERFFIPNVITPSDVDNKNDQFEIKGLDKFEQNEIVIFNRWGDHVFEAKDYQNDWKAKGLNAGSYFYVLTVTDRQGGVHTFKGWIQVIKNGSKFDN